MPIKSARHAANLTQKQLSKLLGIPLRTIEDWESGKRKPPEYVVSLIIYKLTTEGYVVCNEEKQD